MSKERYILNNLLNLIGLYIGKRRKIHFKDECRIFNSHMELAPFFLNKCVRVSLLRGYIIFDAIDYLKLKTKFKNKTVLDIGSWIGDSILLFHKFGAKKIIAYEPIKENVEVTNRFIKRFNINCKLYPYAVCKKSGVMKFIVEEDEYGSVGLSLFKKKVNSPKEIKVKCISWKEVLKKAIKERVDIAKVDCEGCEKFLVSVDDDLIKQIPEWIIECHSLETAKKIYKKFKIVGFRMMKIYPVMYPNINVLYFKYSFS